MNTIGWILIYLIAGTVNAIITWKLFGDRDMNKIEQLTGTTKGLDIVYTIILIVLWPLRVISNILDVK